MDYKEQGYRFANDYPLEHMKNLVDGLDQIIVVPVNTEIKRDQTVLNLDSVKKIVSNSKKITLMDCSCRVDMKHCTHPIETCLTFDAKAEQMLTMSDLKRLRPHPITKDKAMGCFEDVQRGGSPSPRVYR